MYNENKVLDKFFYKDGPSEKNRKDVVSWNYKLYVSVDSLEIRLTSTCTNRQDDVTKKNRLCDVIIRRHLGRREHFSLRVSYI